MHLRAVHFDIGMIRSATATRSTLSKDYVKDEEVELRITEINGDEVTVTDDLHQLAAGQRVTGTVTAVTEGYGVSFNIGGREAFVHLISWRSRCTCARKEKLLRACAFAIFTSTI